MTLYPGSKRHGTRTATLLADGYIEVDGTPYQYPQTAAKVIAGRPRNGLWFCRVDRVGGRSLREVLDDYRTAMAIVCEPLPNAIGSRRRSREHR